MIVGRWSCSASPGPFFSAADSSSRPSSFPLAILVAAGVLVWWFVSGEGPGDDAGDVAKRAALGIGILALCGLIAIGGAWAAAAGGETVVAIVVIGAGVAILVGAFLRPVRWLVLPAVALALSAGAVSAAGIDLDGGVGERDYRPPSARDLRDTYSSAWASLIVDLRQTDLPAGDVPVGIDLGIGDARVIVPDDVCVATDAHVGIGEARTFERHNDGVDVDMEDLPDASAGTTRLLVKADIGVGSLRIGHEGTDCVPRGRALRLRPGLRRARTKRGLCRVAPTRPRWSPASRCWRSACCSCSTPAARSTCASLSSLPSAAPPPERSCSRPG